MIITHRLAVLASSAIATLFSVGCSQTLPSKTTPSTPSASKALLQKASYRQSTNHAAAKPALDRDFDTWERIFHGFQIGNQYSRQPRVQQFVRSYAANPAQVSQLSERASLYLHLIVYELERRDMPTEIAFLPFVESAFNPDIFSQAGAAGLWQFIPATGSDYGLLQTKHYDARLDPFAATGAALTYLQKLHDQFNGDWFLALAAYNCGEGRVERAIADNQARGLPTDYWHLNLPRETREYVPRLLAFKELLNHAQHYGIQLADTPNTARLAQLRIDKPIDLRELAVRAGLKADHITALNPCFRKGISTPQYSNRIVLPREYAHELLAVAEALPAASLPRTRKPTTLTAQLPRRPKAKSVLYAQHKQTRYNQLATVRMGKSKAHKANKTTTYASRNKAKQLRTAQNTSNKQVDA